MFTSLPPSLTAFGLLPPANEACEGYVFTPVCHSVHGGGGGVCIQEGGWAYLPLRILWDTANERAVRILVECILVLDDSAFTLSRHTSNGKKMTVENLRLLDIFSQHLMFHLSIRRSDQSFGSDREHSSSKCIVTFLVCQTPTLQQREADTMLHLTL